MRILHAFNLLVGLFLICLGVFSFITPWSVNLKTWLIGLIVNGSLFFWLFGVSLAAIGVLVFFLSLMRLKTTYYKIRSRKLAIDVDRALLENALKRYWAGAFPQGPVASQLFLKGENIYVTAELPPQNDKGQQKLLLEQVEEEIWDLFHHTLGYRNPIRLEISFQKG